MFKGKDIGTMRIRTRSDISPRSRQMKGARPMERTRRWHLNWPAFFAWPRPLVQHPTAKSAADALHPAARAAIYAAAFITGGIVMGFEMLGSRSLNPHFGSGLYTSAAPIPPGLVPPLPSP